MTKKTLGDFGFVGGITNPIEPEHAVGHLTDKQLEMVNAAADAMSKAKMTNGQKWPDRAYFLPQNEDDSSSFCCFSCCDLSTKWSNGTVEYISATKVREIQLATIRKTCDEFQSRLHKYLLSEDYEELSSDEIAKLIVSFIDPMAIINKIESKS